MIGVTNNKVVDVKGDDYAHNRGRLCIKGLATRDILYSEGRALYPIDLPPLNRSRTSVRVWPKGGPYAAHQVHRRTHHYQAA